MSVSSTQSYKKLSLESSNLMMEGDGHAVFRRYERGAYARRRATDLRVRMAEMALAAGEDDLGAYDMICAATCYALANDRERGREALERTVELQRLGRISTNRDDIIRAIAEVEQMLLSLEDKQSAFRRRVAGGIAHNVESTLKATLSELAGWPELHRLLASQADAEGDPKLAAKQREWAEKFANVPESLGIPHLNGKAGIAETTIPADRP